MAESVNNQLLSAVTEGHHSSTIADSINNHHNINKSNKHSSNSVNNRYSNNSSIENSIHYPSTSTPISKSLTSNIKKTNQRKQKDTSSPFSRYKTSTSSSTQSSSNIKLDRKRKLDQSCSKDSEVNKDLSEHTSALNQKRRRHNNSTKAKSIDIVKTSKINFGESSSSLSSFLTASADCVAFRTRSKTILPEDPNNSSQINKLQILDNIKSPIRNKRNIIASSTNTTTTTITSIPIPATTSKIILPGYGISGATGSSENLVKGNLLNYYRKTRGNREFSKKLGVEIEDQSRSSNSSCDLKDSTSSSSVFNLSSDNSSRLATRSSGNISHSRQLTSSNSKSLSQRKEAKNKDLNSRKRNKKSSSTSYKSRERKGITLKVDKNQKNNYLAGTASTPPAVRNLRSTTVEIGSGNLKQHQQLFNSTSDTFTTPPQTPSNLSSSSASLSYSISFGGGAVPKKRQKVGDYSEGYYSSSTSGSVGQLSVNSSGILSTSSSSTITATSSNNSSYNNSAVPTSQSNISSTTTTTGYSKAPNLGARLARGGGAGRDAPQQLQQQQQPHQQTSSSLQSNINQNYQQSAGLGGAIGESLSLNNSGLLSNQSAGALSSSSHILRRSSRGKTGSCVSSSTAQGSGSGVAASSSSSATIAAGSSSSRTAAHHHHYHHRSQGGAVSTTQHSSSSKGNSGVKYYDSSSGIISGPSTSSQGAHNSVTGLMSNDGSRPLSGDTNNSNPNIKIHKSSLAPPTTGNLDGSNIHLNTSGTSSTGQSTGVVGGSVAAGSTSGATSAAAAVGGHPDSESDDSEVGRLQALLEARGLPPHLFGALGPRMHHILHRTIGASSSSKAQQLLQGLQSHDESQQLQAAIEMCQMLVMGNEDTLAGFPIKQVVPALINLLRMEHNFDIMNNACRALAYMLEALPRSSATVVEAIPVFLEKLQVIQCMDVAEQSLTALEILSRRHNKAILQANGVSACLTYLDFFSINAQRAALAITANCCLNLHPEEFHFVNESLPLLARLLAQQDKKCVESVCTAFYRLVESFQHDQMKLQEIASKELLKNCQQLLVVTPSVLNTGTFTNVVRMLSVMCGNCPDLAISLLKSDIAATLLYLLTGSAEPSQTTDVELVSRSPSELYEITCLIGELMPRLPTDGIFTVDSLLERPSSGAHDQVQWLWRDDRGVWHSYSAIDSRMIEAAHMNSDDEISLSTLGRTYTIDFHSMQQINEDTGTTRPVQRKINTNYIASNMSNGQDLSNTAPTGGTAVTTDPDGQNRNAIRDARIACLNEERGLAADFIKSLFSVLYEVYSSSAGPAVRYKCLRALLRMVYYASADLLKDVLKNQIVSSHIAGMMASNDLRIVVGALQMAEILMQKLPEVFGTHFRREGVIHQITLLSDPNNPICANPSPKQPITGSGALSAPPSASGLQTNPFDFDAATPSSSKTHGSHVKNLSHAMNVLNSKMSISMPSTSATSLQMPSTSSSSLAISLSANASSPIASDVPHPQQAMASSLPNNNGNFLIYSTSADPRHYGHYHHHTPPHFQGHHVDMMASAQQSTSTPPDNHSTPPTTAPTTTSSATAIQNKMTDILKRKVPPKRKSQSSGRSKSRQDESVVQELINRATAIGGSSGRNTPSGSGSRSRFGGASSSTGGGSSTGGTGSSSKTSFLASLNPARWGRQGSHHNSFAKESSSTNAANLGKSASNANLIAAGNREKARQWIRDQAISFVSRYTEQEISKIHPTATVLSRLTGVILKLDGNADECLESLQELKNILMESDISPFEVNHSGLIKAMLTFMSSERGIVSRDDRLRGFLHVFAGLPLNSNSIGIGLPVIKPTPFSALVAKLNGCVTQLEQFPVKVHDFPAGPGGRSNTSALKFFNTHQLKCNLQRHPDCTNLRQWKGGTVKIDPLALVQAIERYLVVRGYGGIRVDSEEDSEEDMDDNVAAVVMSQSGFKHKLQFLIGEHVLPYNMTVYQAVKQYSPLVNDQSETDTDTETPIGNASIWVQQHTIYYRPIDDEHTGSSSSKGASSSLTKRSSKSSSSKLMRKKTEFWQEGNVPNITSPLTPFLASSLPTDIVTVQDASIDALCMLRIINALNRHWECLYGCVQHENIINQSEFIHSKITAKANRQLQDPLVIMTGNLPQWLQQIAMACPFLFPFDTRHLLFYAISFDRDRALQRLLDTTPDLNSSDTTERVTPRLDRRKRAISREEILKQAEHIIQDFGHSKALLEIQYENEVGTGLGPTLEFYALVSAELQRCDLGLWNGSDSYKQNSSTIADVVKSGLAQIDDGNESSGNNRSSSIGVVATNNSLNNQSTIESGTYISHENSLNMIIEQSDSLHTSQTTTSSSTTLMVVRESDNENQVNQDDVTRHQQQQHIENPQINNQLPPAPVVHSVAVTYVDAPHGLFPTPLGKAAKLSQISRVKSKFKFLGKFMAKAVMDSRMLDLPFSIPFYRWLLTEESTLGLAELSRVAPEVQSTLVRLQDIVRQRDAIQLDSNFDAMEKTERIESLDLDSCPIADLGLDFVLPGHANIELRRGGRDIPVTIHNLHQYISLVTHWFLTEGVQRQFEALREGFDTVFSSQRLRMFYPEELENVFCGTGSTNFQRWDLRMLQECCRTDHGFTQDSQAIQFLYDILSSYSRDDQRLFLQFVTGSPRLPTGGFKSLSPPLTIVRKTLDTNQNPDDYLPSVMTCVNYLKLPEYSSREVMRAKLKVAASEGSMSFHLS